MLDTVANGLALSFVALFAFTGAHKIGLLSSGRRFEDPLLAAHPRFAAHPRAVYAAAVATEFTTGALIAFIPPAGLIMAAALLGGYAAALRKLAPDGKCNCFGSLSGASATSASTRNLVLASGAALAGLVLLLGPATGAVTADTGSLTVTVIAVAVLAAFEALERLIDGGGAAPASSFDTHANR